MTTTLRSFLLMSVLTALAAPSLHAQRQERLMEFGIDASFARQSFHSEPDRNGREITTNVNTIAIPQAVIRAGFFITPSVAIEPAFGLRYQHVGDQTSSTTIFDVGLPIYLSQNRREDQLFIRPVVGLDHISFDATGADNVGGSDTQFNFGVGLGIKIPLSDRFASRFEAQYRHAPKTDRSFAYDLIAALVGISVYVR